MKINIEIEFLEREDLIEVYNEIKGRIERGENKGEGSSAGWRYEFKTGKEKRDGKKS